VPTIHYTKGGRAMATKLPEKKNKPIKISMRQYIDNPYKGSAFLASRKAIKAGLNLSFINLIQKYRNLFFAVPYKYNNGDILFHVKVPSEEYQFNKISYDVFFLIEYDKDKRYAQRNIKMISNSPNFLFTYAYVYYHDDLMIERYANRMPDEALNNKPVIRNPVESLGFEKSTYIAARYLVDGQILNDTYINRFGKNMNSFEEMNLDNMFADPEKLVELYALGREMQSKSISKINIQRTAERQKLRTEYVEQSKKNRPESKGFLFKRAPRAKLTPKKAKRSLMNDRK
jgi:hypothetical protein